ncbi:hypothetical protein ACTACT_09900 [Pseudomonas syringae]|uniref:hypothetical protein n=1 Tax=Pseudomonas syringae TaxID=317 RepID=UPI003F74D9AA
MAIVIDLFARRAIGWSFSLVNDANRVSKALRMAAGFRKFTPGLMFHSDQSCQYTSRWSIIDALHTWMMAQRDLVYPKDPACA